MDCDFEPGLKWQLDGIPFWSSAQYFHVKCFQVLSSENFFSVEVGPGVWLDMEILRAVVVQQER